MCLFLWISYHECYNAMGEEEYILLNWKVVSSFHCNADISIGSLFMIYFIIKLCSSAKSCNEFLPPDTSTVKVTFATEKRSESNKYVENVKYLLDIDNGSKDKITRFQSCCSFRVSSSSSTWGDIAAPNSFSLFNKNCQVLLSIKTRASQTLVDWKCFFIWQLVYFLLCLCKKVKCWLCIIFPLTILSTLTFHFIFFDFVFVQW